MIFEKIYALKISGSSGSTQPSNNSSDFESGLQAGIQQCLSNPASCGIALNCDGSSDGTYANYNPANGEVYIPFIKVPVLLAILKSMKFILFNNLQHSLLIWTGVG